jgi:PhnB protein
MKLNPYLTFDGRCEEAFKFYEQLLGGKITRIAPYEGSPLASHVPEDWRSKIMHATLQIGDQQLMGLDAQPGHYETPKGVSVSLNLESAADAERIFNALAEGGKVKTTLQQTFWAARFGMLTDRFGTPWKINCEKDA